MDQNPQSDFAQSSLTALAWTCDQFERRLRAGEGVLIEDWIRQAGGQNRTMLLGLLLCIEIEYRVRRGEPVSPGNYIERFPGDESTIDHAFKVAREFQGESAPVGGPQAAPPSSSLNPDGNPNGTVEHSSSLSPTRSVLDDRSEVSNDEIVTDTVAWNHVAEESAAAETVDQPRAQAEASHLPPRERGNERSSDGRFRIDCTRILAKGGQGKIYPAIDDQLGRPVAAKMLHESNPSDLNANAENRRMREDRLLRRFRRESEITGILQHLAVVPVYGFGTTTQDEPFCAMRWIPGQEMNKCIRQYYSVVDGAGAAVERGYQASEFRKLLQSFVALCKVVAYAHSRGILHRDLKTKNVLIGDFGETFLLDWGLARRMLADDLDNEEQNSDDDDTGAPQEPHGTLGTGTVGTFAYMSPEMANLAPDRNLHALDIFGLGATLYELLTGRAPYDAATWQERLQKAKDHDFKPPRDIRPNTQPALEAICLRAMAKAPGDRYGCSALELAADVERWLADEQVSVYPDTLPDRATRWIRHHQKTAIVATMLVATLFIGLGADNYRVTQQRDEIKREHDLVEHERDRAERSLIMARAAITQFLERGEESLAYAPLADDVRIDFLKTGTYLIDQLRADKPRDTATIKTAANVYHRAANILRLTGGKMVEGKDLTVEYYEKSIDSVKELIADDPTKHSPSVYLAQVEIDLAELHSRRGKFQEASRWLESASRHSETQNGSQTWQEIRTQARALYNGSKATAIIQGDPKAGIERAEKAVGMLKVALASESVTKLARGNADTRLLLAVAYLQLVELKLDSHDYTGATQSLSEARHYLDELRGAELHPADVRFFAAMADLCQARGNLENPQARRLDAETPRLLERCVSELDLLNLQFPGRPHYALQSALGRARWAEALMRAESSATSTAAAGSHCDQAQRTLEVLTERYSLIPEYRLELGEVVTSRARRLLDQVNDCDIGRDLFQQGIELRAAALRDMEYPENAPPRVELKQDQERVKSWKPAGN